MFDSNLFNPTYLLYHERMIWQEQNIGPPFTQLLLRTRRLREIVVEQMHH